MNFIKFILISSLLLLFGCEFSSNKFELNEKIQYNVIRIVDGDTYVLEDRKGSKKKIRIIGADTPETKHPSKGKEPFGKEATFFAKKHLLGKSVRLKFEKSKKDRYGRILAHVFLDSIHFNKMLIDSGYAKALFFKPNFEYENTFKESEKSARSNKLGLWSLKYFNQ